MLRFSDMLQNWRVTLFGRDLKCKKYEKHRLLTDRRLDFNFLTASIAPS